MPTSLIGKTRTRLKTLAQDLSGGGLTLSAARVRLGYARMLESAEFFAQLQSAGPYLSIGTATLDFNTQTAFGPAAVRALLYVGFDRESSQEFTNIDDLLENLRAAWSAPNSYLSGEAAPQHIGWKAWKIDPRPKPGVAAVPIEIVFPDPPLTPAERGATNAEGQAAPGGNNSAAPPAMNLVAKMFRRPPAEIVSFARNWLA